MRDPAIDLAADTTLPADDRVDTGKDTILAATPRS